MRGDPELPRYGDLEIIGTTVDEFGRAITDRLSGPWSRATDIEDSWRDHGMGLGRPLVFRHGDDGRLPAALLYLRAREGGGLYVANVVPAEAGSLTEEQYNALLRDFYDLAAEDAAEEVGAQAELDLAGYDLAARAGAEVRDALARFSRTANKSSGASHPLDQDHFNDFIIAVGALGGGERPGADTVAAWLQADGWSDETSWSLAIQYEQGLALLDRASSRA